MSRFLQGCVAVAALALVTPSTRAQCSALSSSYDSESNTIQHTVTGSTPDAFTVVFVGATPGTTATKFGLTLGLERPFRIARLGKTDANGELMVERMPKHVPSGMTLHFQAVSVSGGSGKPSGRRGRRGGGGGGGANLTFCESNVASVDFP